MTGQECGAQTAVDGLRREHVVLAVRSDAFAGVERYIATTANALLARGHRVTVIGGHADRMRAEAPHAAHVPAASTQQVVRALLRHARGADIVHSHMTAADMAVVLARPLLRGARVSTLHFASPRGSGVIGHLTRTVIRRGMHRQIAISEFVRRTAGEHAVVILNGVPATEPVRASANVVLVAQRLESEKCTADAVLAFRRAGLAGEGWQLWIAGDGSERVHLEGLVTTERIAGVQFLGHRRDLCELRCSAGIFLATAPREPFGLSVAEAMAAALPVIAADGGGHRETVGACRPDMLYPPGDVATAAESLRRLAGDIELRRRLGLELQGWQREHISDGAHVAALREVYEDVAARNRRVEGRAA